MRKLIFSVINLAIIIISLSNPLAAASKTQRDDKYLEPLQISKLPKIDGILNDEAWKAGPMVAENWKTFEPVEGNPFPYKTLVYMAYDYKNIYFAFHCFDPHPEKIKSTITNRDNHWEDDWVAVSIDTLGIKQSAYDLYVNPNGIQGDIYRTVDHEDMDTDWVWYSAGKIVTDGYIVEIRVPLKNIRYTSGKDIEMGILFKRRISRLGIKGSWPNIIMGKGIFNCSAKVNLKKLEREHKLEILPAFTNGTFWDRTPDQSWSRSGDSSFGIGIKYGITSSVTAEFTINPDFSQVETDDFQIEVNQRYPIFFREKRPFFMEAKNLFNVAGASGNGNMYTAVHTRNIVEPGWGARITGDVGKVTFGFLGASDEWNPEGFGSGVDNTNQKPNFWIGRCKYSLPGENYVGIIYSGKENGDEYNRVMGGDISVKFGKNLFLANYLTSYSNRPEQGGKYQGNTLTAVFVNQSRSHYVGLRFERFSTDFQMDTAFMQRTGFTKLYTYIRPSFFPSPKKYPWFKKINIYCIGSYIYDFESEMADKFIELGAFFDFIKDGVLGGSYSLHREVWVGRHFDKKNLLLFGGIWVTKWLYFEARLMSGNSIFYDYENPFLGESTTFQSGLVFQPNKNIRLSLYELYSEFKDPATQEKVYDINIFRSYLTYQFNKYLFIRGIVQFDSYRKVILSDLLASFTIIPGTAIYLGYGSLHEKTGFNTPDYIHYQQSRQSLFLKLSYLIQL
jgi:hypothetical protein